MGNLLFALKKDFLEILELKKKLTILDIELRNAIEISNKKTYNVDKAGVIRAQFNEVTEAYDSLYKKWF